MEKQVLSVRLEPAIIERLKQICAAEDASQSKIIKRMISSWNIEVVKETEKTQPIIKSIVHAQKKEVKPIIKSS